MSARAVSYQIVFSATKLIIIVLNCIAANVILYGVKTAKEFNLNFACILTHYP